MLDIAHCTHTPCAARTKHEHETEPAHSRSARDTRGSAREHATKLEANAEPIAASCHEVANQSFAFLWLRAPYWHSRSARDTRGSAREHATKTEANAESIAA